MSIAVMTRDEQSIAREAAIRNAPPSTRRVLQRAYSGTSRTAAVKAMCLMCVGYVRADVRHCSSLACPLHPYRPYQSGDADDDAPDAEEISQA